MRGYNYEGSGDFYRSLFKSLETFGTGSDRRSRRDPDADHEFANIRRIVDQQLAQPPTAMLPQNENVRQVGEEGEVGDHPGKAYLGVHDMISYYFHTLGGFPAGVNQQTPATNKRQSTLILHILVEVTAMKW